MLPKYPFASLAKTLACFSPVRVAVVQQMQAMLAAQQAAANRKPLVRRILSLSSSHLSSGRIQSRHSAPSGHDSDSRPASRQAGDHAERGRAAAAEMDSAPERPRRDRSPHHVRRRLSAPLAVCAYFCSLPACTATLPLANADALAPFWRSTGLRARSMRKVHPLFAELLALACFRGSPVSRCAVPECKTGRVFLLRFRQTNFKM